MEALLPRLASLCSQDESINPWCAQNIRFVFTGVQGDLKWVNNKYGLYPYNSNACCSRCNAVKSHPDKTKTIGCFTDAASFTAVSHEDFIDGRPIDDWPAPMTLGVRLERFQHDICHSQLLGTGKVHNGSLLVFLCESGEFSDNGLFPQAGFYDSNLQSQLKTAYVHFKAWCKDEKLAVNQPRFTIARCNRRNRACHPCLASKAISGKVVSFWLAARCCERANRNPNSALDQLIASCAWAYAAMLKGMDEADLVLTEPEAENIFSSGMLYLQTYARLRALSASILKGKVPMRSSWTLLPKHHFLWHALHDLRQTLVNTMLGFWGISYPRGPNLGLVLIDCLSTSVFLTYEN